MNIKHKKGNKGIVDKEEIHAYIYEKHCCREMNVRSSPQHSLVISLFTVGRTEGKSSLMVRQPYLCQSALAFNTDIYVHIYIFFF